MQYDIFKRIVHYNSEAVKLQSNILLHFFKKRVQTRSFYAQWL